MADTQTRVLESGLDEETVSIDRMEIFRAGDYGDRGVYGEADLDAMAATYDPAKHEAPATLDHAKEGPAYGWISRAWREGQSLFAAVRNVPKTLAVAIQNGRYGKRSAEIYRNGIKGISEGKPYLRAVSFLGAQVPVVKGMSPLPSLMSEAAAFSEFDFPGGASEADQTITSKVDASPAISDLPPASTPREPSSANMAEDVKCSKCKGTIHGKPTMKGGQPYHVDCVEETEDTPEEEEEETMSEQKDEKVETPEVDVKAFSEKIDALTATAKSQAEEIKALREANAKIKAEARDAMEAARFSEVKEQSRREGRVPAALIPKLAALFAALPFDEDAKVIEFGEGEDKKTLTPRGILLDIMQTSPRLEIYAETISTEESIAAGAVDPHDYENAAVDKRAKTLFAEGKGASYEACLIMASRELKKG